MVRVLSQSLPVRIQTLVRVVQDVVPNILSVLRLLVASAYAAWGTAPAGSAWLALLIVGAASAMLSGRAARVIGRSNSVGGTFETTADRLFSTFIMARLASSGQIDSWLLAAQLVVLGGTLAAAVVHTFRLHHIPVPDLSTHVCVLIGIALVLPCLAGPTAHLAQTLVALVVGVNLVDLCTAWIRAVYRLPPSSRCCAL